MTVAPAADTKLPKTFSPGRGPDSASTASSSRPSEVDTITRPVPGGATPPTITPAGTPGTPLSPIEDAVSWPTGRRSIPAPPAFGAFSDVISAVQNCQPISG